MTEIAPRASHAFRPGELSGVLEFLKRTRSELRSLSFVRVWADRVQVLDVNRDYFEVTGVGYPDADVEAILQAVNVPFNPATIHEATEDPYKEFRTGRRYPWAADRVM